MEQTTDTLTLTGFLLARIAEDEAHAREAAGDPWRIRSTPWGKTFDIVADDRDSRADHWFCVDPARVLAEVEAKRRIVEEHKIVRPQPCHCGKEHEPWPPAACDVCASSSIAYLDVADRSVPCETLVILANVYAEHVDFREEWRA